MGKTKLFCFSYAGGSSIAFSQLRQQLDKNIELCPIEYSGRGVRYDTPLYNCFEDAVEDMYQSIKDRIVNDNYALLGYSMGSWITHELYYKLKQFNHPVPQHIFFAAKEAPHIVRTEHLIHNLPDEQFKEKILGLGGTNKEAFENKELFEYFFPILREDYNIVENYVYQNREDKIRCSISIFHGIEDSITLDEIKAWNKYTSKECEFYYFDEGHFFIHNNIKAIANIINKTLL